jgi:hypothetical protein
MISCIICSNNDVLLRQIIESIKQTIGVYYEIVAIDNKQKKKGICAVYNEGASKAIFPYLCFVHEDVVFENIGWGNNVIAHFEKDSALGLIGVAGGRYKSKVISTWYYPRTGDVEFNRYNYKQTSKKDPSQVSVMNMNPDNEILSQVVCLDGVLLITKKDIWEQQKFDEVLLDNFHAYDIDFSLTIHQQYKVAVVYDVFINHISDGFANHIWVREAFKLHKKWNKKLPMFMHEVQTKLDSNANDKGVFYYCLDVLRKKRGNFWLEIRLLLYFFPIMNSKESQKKRLYFILIELKKSIVNLVT